MGLARGAWGHPLHNHSAAASAGACISLFFLAGHGHDQSPLRSNPLPHHAQDRTLLPRMRSLSTPARGRNVPISFSHLLTVSRASSTEMFPRMDNPPPDAPMRVFHRQSVWARLPPISISPQISPSRAPLPNGETSICPLSTAAPRPCTVSLFASACWHASFEKHECWGGLCAIRQSGGDRRPVYRHKTILCGSHPGHNSRNANLHNPAAIASSLLFLVGTYFHNSSALPGGTLATATGVHYPQISAPHTSEGPFTDAIGHLA